MSNHISERNGQVIAHRQISTAKTWNWQVQWIFREDSSCLVFEVTAKRTRNSVVSESVWKALEALLQLQTLP